MKESGQILILEPVADSLVARLFAALDDESWRYKMAEKAIDKIGMKVFRLGSVEAWLMFEDFTETALDMFEDYGQELNRNKTAWRSFWAITGD